MSMSVLNASDAAELGKSTYPSLGLGNSFAFKFEDHKGRVHRFNLGESYYQFFKGIFSVFINYT